MNSLNKLLNNPTQENKELYLKEVNQIEYQLLEEAENYPYKSREYFSKRTEAFSFRKKSAMELITLWVKKYGNVNDCPVKYVDTLNIPFQSIKVPL